MLYAHTGPHAPVIAPHLTLFRKRHTENVWMDVGREYKLVYRAGEENITRREGDRLFPMDADRKGKIRSMFQSISRDGRYECETPVEVYQPSDAGWAHDEGRNLNFGGADNAINTFIRIPNVQEEHRLDLLRFRVAANHLLTWVENTNASVADLRGTMNVMTRLAGEGNTPEAINDTLLLASKTGLYSRARDRADVKQHGYKIGKAIWDLQTQDVPSHQLFPGFAALFVVRGWGTLMREVPYGPPRFLLVPPTDQQNTERFYTDTGEDVMMRWWDWYYANTLRLVATLGRSPLPELHNVRTAMETIYPALFHEDALEVTYVKSRGRRRAVS